MTPQHLYRLVRDAMAVMRLTSLLVSEDGPNDMLAKFRDRIGIQYDVNNNPYAENMMGQAFTCYKCASIWVAFAIRFLPEWVREVLALSGIAIRWQR